MSSIYILSSIPVSFLGTNDSEYKSSFYTPFSFWEVHFAAKSHRLYNFYFASKMSDSPDYENE